jgi:hypothetical protein
VQAVLATGTSLRQPGLWVKPGVSPIWDAGVRDSLGRYNEPPADFSQEMFANKMRTFWLQRNQSSVIGVGTSHLAFGMQSQAFTHFHAINLGTAGAPVGVNINFLRQLVIPHSPRLKAVVFDILLGNLFGSFNENPVWHTALGHAYDRDHGFWVPTVPAHFDSIMRHERVEPSVGRYDSLGSGGHQMFPSIGWGADPPVNYLQGSGSLTDPSLLENLNTLMSLSYDVSDRGIFFLMVLFPESPKYLNTPYYAKHGPSRAAGRTLVDTIRVLCGRIPRCRFYDANLDGKHDFDSTDFSDEDHLNPMGADKLSRRLDSVIFDAVPPRP